MRALGILAGVAILAISSQAASAADVGATAGVPMPAGSAWGHSVPMAPSAAAMPGGPAYAPAPLTRMAPPPGALRDAPPPRWAGRGDYRRPTPGWKVPKHYRDRSYIVADWRGWGFAPPGPGMAWVRYYDDAVLVDDGGRVVDCRYGVNWNDGYPRRGYAGGPGYGYAPPQPGYPMPGTRTYQAGPNTRVTTTVTPLGVPAVYPLGGCCGGVVTVTPGMQVTTTTTTTDYVTRYRKVAVRKKWRPTRHPRCVQKICTVQGS
ncbi:RcnB family protein [Sphingomonas oryzagri]